jgi:hypothetical protein
MALNLGDLDSSNGFCLDGVAAFDNSGLSVAGAREVSGDGIDDLIIGPRAPIPVGRTVPARTLTTKRLGERTSNHLYKTGA